MLLTMSTSSSHALDHEYLIELMHWTMSTSLPHALDHEYLTLSCTQHHEYLRQHRRKSKRTLGSTVRDPRGLMERSIGPSSTSHGPDSSTPSG